MRPLNEAVRKEYLALTEGAGAVDVSDRTQVRVSGADRVRFLHGFCTNDIQRLSAGAGCETFLANARGKLVGHVFVFCDAEGLTLETSPGQAESLIRHLDRYVIREDVQFQDLNGLVAEFLVAGQRSPELLAGLTGRPAPAEMLSHEEAVLASAVPISLRRVPLAVPSAFLLSCPAARRAEVQQLLLTCGAMVCGAEAFEAVRIEAGFPCYGRDITEEHLPQEVNRNAQAISFTKGCYLGQETVARINALGHVNRKLVQLSWQGPEPLQPGQDLKLEEQVVGRVTSAAWSPRCGGPLALAYLRRGLDRPGTRLETGGGIAEVVEVSIPSRNS